MLFHPGAHSHKTKLKRFANAVFKIPKKKFYSGYVSCKSQGGYFFIENLHCLVLFY